MPLIGEGLLAVWTDVEPAAEADFNLWYTHQHVPERVGVPGFARGRRYAAPERDKHRYCAFYETQSLAVLSSPLYVARLNDPTDWTQRVMPNFRNMIRGACRTVATAGHGVGGSLATVRLDLPQGPEGIDTAALKKLTRDLAAQHGVVGAHVIVRDRSIVGAQTVESALRTTPDALFDAAILIESSSRPELEAQLPAAEKEIAAVWRDAPIVDVAVYDLAFALTPEPA
ncbi:MAG: hypothetical protein J0H89_02260 [Rhizobiales bacterium]|nr:hypothetical protein [Hyphomicrobiales bacterium]